MSTNSDDSLPQTDPVFQTIYLLVYNENPLYLNYYVSVTPSQLREDYVTGN